MPNAIISDTSCLILLDKIGHTKILHNLFGTIVTTTDVAKEFGKPLPDWITIVDPVNKNYQSIIEISLDKGEASAIALAVEIDNCLLIIDELKGRNFAKQLGLNVTGTLGILVDAKLEGHISSLRETLKAIKNTNFRISSDLEKILLEKAGE